MALLFQILLLFRCAVVTVRRCLELLNSQILNIDAITRTQRYTALRMAVDRYCQNMLQGGLGIAGGSSASVILPASVNISGNSTATTQTRTAGTGNSEGNGGVLTTLSAMSNVLTSQLDDPQIALAVLAALLDAGAKYATNTYTCLVLVCLLSVRKISFLIQCDLQQCKHR